MKNYECVAPHAQLSGGSCSIHVYKQNKFCFVSDIRLAGGTPSPHSKRPSEHSVFLDVLALLPSIRLMQHPRAVPRSP